PVCCEVQKDIAYAEPCRHQFCLGCILRWAKQKESCPLCRTAIRVIKAAAWNNEDELDFIIWPPAPLVPVCFQAVNAPGYSPHRPAPSPPPSLPPFPPPFLLQPEEQEAVEAEEESRVGGLLPEVWAALFRQHQEMLRPLLPWLRQELLNNFGAAWWHVMVTESIILSVLCNFGPDSEALNEIAWCGLGDRAQTLTLSLIDTIVQHCSEEAYRQLGLQHVRVSRGQEDSPVDAPGPAASPLLTLTSRPGPFGST
ncbi:TOPRS ligase, partial [Penelope pileata]|nr:TOPRS ligase [Penelope pileata]